MNAEGDRVIKTGDKLLACHRRLFENDEPRYFAGEVLSSNDSLIKIRGYSHFRNLSTGHFECKSEVRTKVISILSGAYILYELPQEVPVDSLQIVSECTTVSLRSGNGFSLDLTEFSGSAHRR
jgi:hypothetical protein